MLFNPFYLKIDFMFFESLERALLPRPAAYKAAALLGWAIEAPKLCPDHRTHKTLPK